MRKKILFVVPPCVAISELIQNEKKMFSTKIRKEIPLGVLSLATYIKQYNNVEAYILDLNLYFYELVKENKISEIGTVEKYIYSYINEYREIEIDFCGISAIFSPTYGYLEIISRVVKEIFPDALVMAGGGIPSNLMKEVFRDAPSIDVISYGEGEIAISGFIDAEDEQEYIENSKSLVTLDKLTKGFPFEFEFIHDLDEIPTLDFSLIKFEKYNSHAHSQNEQETIAIPLMFSRGCPFNCCFCSSHSVHGKKVRYNSLKRIKKDVELFVNIYHANTITVWDDNFFVDKEQAIELLDFFEELKLRVEFVNGFPVYRIDDDIVNRLKRAGVEVVTLAIESGNPRVLKDIIHKPLTLEMIPKAIECLERHGIYSKGLFVIGFPGETLEDIDITMNYIHNSKLNWVDIFIAAPLPGSELYDVCKQKGYLKHQDLDIGNYTKGNIETEFFTSEQIEEIQVYNTIKKDFVYNLDMQNCRWDRALINFEYVINAGHENPFAYYYASIAAGKLSMLEKQKQYYSRYAYIRNMNHEWKDLFQRFVSEGVNFI